MWLKRGTAGMNLKVCNRNSTNLCGEPKKSPATCSLAMNAIVNVRGKVMYAAYAFSQGQQQQSFSVSYLAAGVVGMFSQFAIESLQENLVRDFAHVHAGFIQHGEDALMLLLHQIHNDLIIEVINLTIKHKEGFQLWIINIIKLFQVLKKIFLYFLNIT